MTKFILHGGNSSAEIADNESFFLEMLAGTGEKVRILLNYFSRKDDSDIQKCRVQDTARFRQMDADKQLEFEIADTKNFSGQLKACDVLYVRGGETEKLVQKMKLTNNLENLIKGKIIGGSSAGVYVFAKYYWENDEDKIGEGLGITNIKAYCHYSPQENEKLNKLALYKEDLPVLTLPNYKWVVFFK
ncbi:hypothetical protein A2972_01650 [Candidatus Amesbacteria bacterium RIFCSPLOWO2_01_FULL_47_33]|uniref:Peptidase n=1 Tax=Candidatus Amesbacteria bacterium RIFCSPLOWO2_01_FULL_47_33 TaxID=1797258 RepID=A0A1F4Z2M3_9BACT|nr:MAG: hypothetical protein A2972_01650 [Candidatus Amesbacteria bacterium RIFCSPLOWO2_01_FULL_47_33]